MIWSAIRLIPPDGVSRRKGKWTGEYIVTKRRDTKNSVRLSPKGQKTKICYISRLRRPQTSEIDVVPPPFPYPVAPA